MFSIVAGAMAPAADGAEQTANPLSMLIWLLPIALLYIVMILPQRKKEKQAKAMRENITVGDEIITIGGIVGKVIKIKDDEFTIETGSDKNRLVMKKWSINTVNPDDAAKSSASAAKKPVDDGDDEAYLDEYVDEVDTASDGKKKKKK